MPEQLPLHDKDFTNLDPNRDCWLAPHIEQYVDWMTGQRYAARTVTGHINLLASFGEFTQRKGVNSLGRLRDHIEGFVRARLRKRKRTRHRRDRRRHFVAELRRPIDQMLALVSPDPNNTRCRPFVVWAPDFFEHLHEERGLTATTIEAYRYHLSKFEQFLSTQQISKPGGMSAATFDSFLAAERRRVSAVSLIPVCAALRVFVRYLFREELVRKDLSEVICRPVAYKLSGIPRCISWDEVIRSLACICRRSASGKRDYAVLTLLASYGLRAREVAALTLEDLDWANSTVHIHGRKAGNSSTYPLSAEIAEGLVDYIKNARPKTTHRQVFLLVRAPWTPIAAHVVSQRAQRLLANADVKGYRLGSHTLRHSVAQRLVEADFSLKEIGDYLGHRDPSTTHIYTKIDLEPLRDLALGNGEQIL